MKSHIVASLTFYKSSFLHGNGVILLGRFNSKALPRYANRKELIDEIRELFADKVGLDGLKKKLEDKLLPAFRNWIEEERTILDGTKPEALLERVGCSGFMPAVPSK